MCIQNLHDCSIVALGEYDRNFTGGVGIFTVLNLCDK